MNSPQAEPLSQPAGGTAPVHDIPALSEQLSVLVSTGKTKEAIGVKLTHDEVKRLTDNQVVNCTKR